MHLLYSLYFERCLLVLCAAYSATDSKLMSLTKTSKCEETSHFNNCLGSPPHAGHQLDNTCCGKSSHSVTNTRCSWVGPSCQQTSIIKAFGRVELRTAVRPFHHLQTSIQNLSLMSFYSVLFSVSDLHKSGSREYEGDLYEFQCF